MQLSKSQIERLLTISRAYYQDGLSQLAIAHQLGLSRPTVAKELQLARESGIVEIKIVDPFADSLNLQQHLRDKYHLKDVIISEPLNYADGQLTDQLGQVAAHYLDSIVTDGDTLSINWGHTLAAVARHLTENQHLNVHVVPLKGSVTNAHENNFSLEIIQRFNHAFHTQASALPLPIIFGDARLRDNAMQDRFIHQIIHQSATANIALFTVGTTQPDTLMFRSGYLSPAEQTHLRHTAVGDVISHFITTDGQLADPALDARTVSLPLSQLKLKQFAILVAGGHQKLRAIHAALLGGYANVLIVDQPTAKALLTYD